MTEGALSDPKPINFTRGVPAVESFPVDEVIAAATAALQEHGRTMLQYGPSAGFAPLREWLAQWQGVPVDQMLTGNGSLQIVEFLCFAMLKPGDIVFTEAPTYDRTLTMLRRHGADIVGIRLESDGPDLAALESEVKKRRPLFFYTIPDFQNPAGATCSGPKRKAIAELAEKYGFLIVEDAPYRPLRYRGTEEPTLFNTAPQRTLHMSSFSKLIGPGPRVGFMMGAPDVLAKIAKVAEDTYISPNYLAQGITYEWCRRGLLGPQIARLKALYAPRRLPARDREVHARGSGHASRRRLLPVADAARRRVDDGRARGRRQTQPQSRRRSRLLPERRRRAFPAAPVLRAHAGRDRRRHPPPGHVGRRRAALRADRKRRQGRWQPLALGTLRARSIQGSRTARATLHDRADRSRPNGHDRGPRFRAAATVPLRALESTQAECRVELDTARASALVWN
jgi:2-aminoadipate transaminase